MADREYGMKSIQFSKCRADWYPDASYIETVFEDGTKVPAAPDNTEGYREYAKSLGYDDPAVLCREHELLHTWLSEKQGHPYSATLWAVAHALETKDEFYYEEQIVLDFQRYMNGHDASAVLYSTFKNADLPKMRQDAILIFRTVLVRSLAK